MRGSLRSLQSVLWFHCVPSLSFFFPERTSKLVKEAEIRLLDKILQLKSMMPLHTRCVTMLSNLHVSGVFHHLISRLCIPSVMTLLIYYVTNHIKLRKKVGENGDDRGSGFDAQQNLGGSLVNGEDRRKIRRKNSSSSTKIYTTKGATSKDSKKKASGAGGGDPRIEVDEFFDNSLYHDFVESSCAFLGNLTSSGAWRAGTSWLLFRFDCVVFILSIRRR